MKTIHRYKLLPLEFRNIFHKPMSVVDYEHSKEFVRTHHFIDDTQYSQTIEVKELGTDPKKFMHENRYSRIPDLYLQELANVSVYQGISHSQEGFFIDNIRIRDESDNFNTFNLHWNTMPLRIANKIFVHSVFPQTRNSVTYDQPAMVFHTINAFGHYLVEALPLLHVFEQGFSPKLILPHNCKEVPAYLLDMVKPFCLDEKAFIIPAELSVFKTLYVPRRPYMQGQFMANAADRVFRRIASFYSSSTNKELKLYLSRRGNRRALHEEDEIENIFADKGFTIVRPESLPFHEQVSLAASATHIAGPIGAALHLVLFSMKPRKLKTLFLSPKGFPSFPAFLQIEHFHKRTPHVIYGEYFPSLAGHPLEDYGRGSWKISLENLRCGLRQWLGDE